MEFQGQERIEAPQQAVWEFVTDPNRFAVCARGFQNLKVEPNGDFTFELTPMGQRVKIEATWLERAAPNRAQMRMHGGNFFGKATIINTLELTPDGDNATQARWHAHVELTGMLARAVGDRIGPMIENLNKEVYDCVRRQVTSG